MSIIPVSATNRKTPTSLKLFSANNSKINTYGELRLTLDFGLRRPITWNFCVANIPFAIIGADLLRYYKLSVNLHNRTLDDQITSLSVRGKIAKAPGLKISFINRASAYAHIFNEFPEIIGVTQGTPSRRERSITTLLPPVLQLRSARADCLPIS